MDGPSPRAALELRICDMVLGGKTLAWLETQPGFPSRRTVWRWARENPAFAEGLKQAQAWRRGQLGWARAAPSFHAAQAEALIDGLRDGAPLKALLARRELPGRRTLNRWKRERPDFAAALAAALAAPGRVRPTRARAYDEAVADRIVVRVARGEKLAEVLRSRDLAGHRTVAAWRRAEPGFDEAVRMAILAGRRRRAAAARRASPALAARICRRIAGGATLDSLAGTRGAPHRATLHRWLKRDAAFAEQVRKARLARDEPLADAVLDLAEAATPQTLAATQARIAEIKRTLAARKLTFRTSAKEGQRNLGPARTGSCDHSGSARKARILPT